MTGKNKELRWPDMPRIKHPFRLAAIMTCELLMVYEAVCYPGSPMALMFTAIQIMLTVFAYFWPRACASVCLIMLVAADYLCAMRGESFDCALYGAILSIGLLAYGTNDWCAGILVLLVSINQGVETALFSNLYPGYSFKAFPVFIVIFLITALCGASFRRLQERNRAQWAAERARHENERLKRNTEIASRIHDAVTSDLSLAALQSSWQMNDDRVTDKEQWKDVNERIVAALGNVRDVIDYMETDEKPTGPIRRQDDESPRCLQWLRRDLERHDKMLRSVGFHGSGQLNVLEAPLDIDDGAKDIIGRLMNEVYANISRHAPSGSKYEVSVLVKTHSLEITEVNDMGARHSGTLPGGHGLRQFAAEIEHIGGRLSADCENGIWMFHARIPLD